MRNTDGIPLRNVPIRLFSTTGANEGKTYSWGSWKPPTGFVEGVPRLWLVAQCMGALGWGE